MSSMCGRFTYRLTWEEIVRLYRLTLDQPAQNTRARYNICPTTTIDTIVEREGKRELARMRWGLVPSWVICDCLHCSKTASLFAVRLPRSRSQT